MSTSVPPASRQRFALKVATVYAVVGMVWIPASDHILELLVQDAAMMSFIQSIKGWVFVGVSALFLYYMLRAQQADPLVLPAGGRTPGARKPLLVTVYLALALLIAVIVANLAFTLWQDRKDQLREAELTTQILARVIEERTAGMLDAIDLTLQSLAYKVNAATGPPAARAGTVAALLKADLAMLRDVRALFMLDASGRMVHDTDSTVVPPVDFSDREYFTVQRDDRAAGLYISRPLQSRTTGKWFISMSRRLGNADGSFAGVIVAAVDMERLNSHLETARVGRFGVVFMARRDGIMLARAPLIAGSEGQDVSASPLYTTRLRQADSGAYHSTSLVDGVTRLYAYRVLPGRPVVVSVGHNEEEILAGWYASARTYALVSLTFIIAVVWLGWLLGRELVRQDRLTDALHLSERRYRLLFDANPNAMAVYDLESLRFLEVNAAALRQYGYTRDEFLGMTVHDLREDRSITRLPGATRGADAFAGTEMRLALERHLRKDGVAIDVEVVSDMLDFAGRRARMVLLLDVTQRKRAEDQVHRMTEELERRVEERTAELRAVNRELEAFSYSVSHDLRAPLRHLNSYTALLREEAGGLSDAGLRHLDTISRVATRMSALTEDLLEFSRNSRSEMTLAKVQLSPLLESVRAEVMREAEGRDVEWRIGALPDVMADAGLLQPVFKNLLSNALKFTSQRPLAVIEVGEQPGTPDEVVIFVRDNGAGFDMRFADKLFGVFQRLHSETEFPGTGIGLATVARIVQRHGGRVWAEAVPDAGATFYIALKRAP